MLEQKQYHFLPSKWSLHYIMTKREWTIFRGKAKSTDPEWNKCDCPNRCEASQLDERWDYNDRLHSKSFVEARFLCKGCHWIKTLPWRIDFWKRQQLGLVPPLAGAGHIVECLGWTQAKVDNLRNRDLERDAVEQKETRKMYSDISSGLAIPYPWEIDLSGLEIYGYSKDDIAIYEARMRRKAEEQVQEIVVDSARLALSLLENPSS